MSDTWNGGANGGKTSWFNANNWSGGVPVISATGTQSVIINGGANQPIIPFNQSEITVDQTVNSNGVAEYNALTETQIGGESITLNNGANLSLQGIAVGVFYGNTGLTGAGKTMTGLHGATSTIASYDHHMSIIATGTADTLTVETVNENFGLISIGNGDTLTIYNTFGNGANAQDFHGLINYGLITVATGGHLTISAAGSANSTIANFYNAGWIEVDGGTLSISSSVLDGSNTVAGAGTTDGYIEIGASGDVILSNTVAAAEEVTFTDTTANTLQITAGTLFSGTVNNFGPSDTIVVNGFTSTSNATITTVGGVTELVTTNGSVNTTITLTGTTSTQVVTSYNSATSQEVISGGGSNSYSSGTSSDTGVNGTITNTSTVTVSGATTDLVLNSPVVGTGGAYFIDNSATLTLDNTTGNDSSQTVIFGTHGTPTAPNTLLINDGTAGFGGAVTSFGSGDDILLGGSTLPALTTGEGVVLNYSTTSHVLTISETNASGTVIATETLSITGTPALSTGSFIGLESTAGLNIELAPTAATAYTFSASSTSSFEAPGNFSGGVAPGDVLSANETVTISAGTASVSTGGITDNGTITVASGAGFTDAGSLSGTGKLAVGAGGKATLTGNTSLTSITDNGTLTLSGSVAAPITLGTGAQVILSGNITDTAVISGPGTLTVNSGVTATLAAGSSFTAINNFGTLDVLGGTAAPVDMEGNVGSVLVLPLGGTIPVLTSFGTGDQLIASGVSIAAGDGLVLSYNAATGVLTGTETASNGTTIGTSGATITGITGTTFSTGSFIALESTAGVTIELAPTSSTTYNFSATGTGSFEAPADYTGGTAPGDVLSTNETVAITHGIASVSSGGVTDNGLITIASGTGFTDAGSLSGTGSLVVGAGGSGTLTGATSLTSITDAGSLTLAGTDAAAVTLASTGQVTLSGNFSDSAAINGAGTLTVNSGVTATLASGSIASVLDAGTLDLTGSFGGSINMQGNTAHTVAEFTGASDVTSHTLNTALTNFGYSDKITVGTADFSLTSAADVLHETYSNGVLTVTDTTNGGSLNINLGITSGDLASYLTVSGASGQLALTLCFYPGTALATPSGEAKVEDITAGDMVMTINGAMPVRWIGQSHIHTRFADPLRALPIRIRQGALGDGLPARDLLLSPDHAIAIDGILVQASALVNGATIIRETQVPEQFTYYHIELDSHELLLAEGVQAESFVDNVDRMHFHNWDGREAPATSIAEMDLPRAKSTRQLPMALRRQLGLNQFAVA